MKTPIIIIAFALSGCAALDKRFESNIMVDLTFGNAIVDSRWWTFGISSKLSKESADEIQRLLKADRARQDVAH